MRTLDIVIPTYNNTPVLTRCLQALETSAPGRHRLIVVDDGSEPSHRAQMAAVLSGLKRDVAPLIHEQNKGFKEAILTAMQFSDARYVLLLNDDTVPTADFDLKLLEVIERGDKVGGVGPVSRHPTDLFQFRPELRGITCEPTTTPADFQAQFEARSTAAGTTDVPFLTGMCLLLDREVFEKVGFFDGAYEHGYFEDLELCCRVRQLGYRLVVREDCFVYHVGHETYKHKPTEEKARIIWRNFAIYERNWAHLPEHQELLKKMEYAGKEHPI